MAVKNKSQYIDDSINLNDEKIQRKGISINILDDAFNKYKNISKNPINSKLKQLPFWLNKESNILLEENNGKQSKKVKFKRGTIVIVDFGVKIGSELSNPHFAIVLTKNDTPYNKVVTVLPLSSKGTRYNYPLKKLIINEFTRSIKKHLKELEKQSAKINKLLEDVDYDSVIEKVQNYQQLNKEERIIFDKYIESCKIAKKIQPEFNKMNEVINFYELHKKNTFACINQITTVSKERIYNPINEYDIIGVSKCPDEVLNEIDSLIVDNYTNLGNNKNSKKNNQKDRELTFS